MNLIDIIKIGLKKSEDTSIHDFIEDEDSVKNTLIERIESNRNKMNTTEKIKLDLIDALMSIKNLAQTANLSSEQIQFYAELSVMNRYFYADSKLIEDTILLNAVLPISKNGSGRAQIVDILKWSALSENDADTLKMRQMGGMG